MVPKPTATYRGGTGFAIQRLSLLAARGTDSRSWRTLWAPARIGQGTQEIEGSQGSERSCVAEGSISFGCSLGVSLISQSDRNGNKQKVSVKPGRRDVTQKHTGSSAEVARQPCWIPLAPRVWIMGGVQLQLELSPLISCGLWLGPRMAQNPALNQAA